MTTVIISHIDMEPKTGPRAKGISTTVAKADTLLQDGYDMRRNVVHGRVIVTVTGQPTEHINRETGRPYLKTHGPYQVDIKAFTCTCTGFGNHEGVCKHAKAAVAWNAAWEEGRSLSVRIITLSEGPIAFREIGGNRYHVEVETRRVVVFRDWDAAANYWQENGLIEHCEIVALGSADLEDLAATGRYAGIAQHTLDGIQPLPLPEPMRGAGRSPEVDWKARAARGGFIKQEDFD